MPKDLLFKLLRNLYNLKSFERLLNQNVIVFNKCICFKQFNKNLNILICYWKSEISIDNIYVNDIFLVSKIMITLNGLNLFLAVKYNIKDFEEVKIIKIL